MGPLTACTPAAPVTIEGVAVRTHGGRATVTIGPGDDGYAFRRADTGERFPADLDHLVEVPNCTALGRDGRPAVLFVEHVLAALWGLGYTAAEVTVDGAEVPLVDGSALPYATALAGVGRTPLAATPEPVRLDRPLWYVAEGQCFGLLPADSWSVHYTFEHAHPRIAQDWVALDATSDFATEVAPARTFATAEEIEALRRQGLVKGGSESNLLVVYNDRLSAPLRLPHEFAAHKVLDLIGDLALLGRPLHTKMIAFRTGHSDNHAVAGRLRQRLAESPGRP